MGHPIDPLEKGEDCIQLFPTPGTTPKKLMAVFSGITDCPGGPWGPGVRNETFVMEQIRPCEWLWTDGTYYARFFYDWFGNFWNLRQEVAGNTYFSGRNASSFPSHYVNIMICAFSSQSAFGGTAFIDLFDLPGTARKMMVDWNLLNNLDTLFDPYSVQDEPSWVTVRRFANIEYSMRLRIKHDATHEDQFDMHG